MSGDMRRVKLLTNTGDFVHEGVIPPFVGPPDVVTWGVRTFKFSEEQTVRGGYSIYRECFAVALVFDKDGKLDPGAR